eukprot:jgi/Mesen1/6526/ME000333S05833
MGASWGHFNLKAVLLSLAGLSCLGAYLILSVVFPVYFVAPFDLALRLRDDHGRFSQQSVNHTLLLSAGNSTTLEDSSFLNPTDSDVETNSKALDAIDAEGFSSNGNESIASLIPSQGSQDLTEASQIIGGGSEGDPGSDGAGIITVPIISDYEQQVAASKEGESVPTGKGIDDANVSPYVTLPSASPSISASSPPPPSASPPLPPRPPPPQRPPKEAPCDLYDGEWVMDKENYPLYKSEDCPFIEAGFNCQKNGRALREYEDYGWRPRACRLPRFDAHAMLSALRNKRILFSGDSMMRQMYQSLVCLLAVGPSSAGRPVRVREVLNRVIKKGAWNFQFQFADYNASVDFVWSTHLVQAKAESNETRRLLPPDSKRSTYVDVRRLDAWTWYALHNQADMVVLSTGPWWSSFMRNTYGHRVYTVEGDAFVELPPEQGLTAALATLHWAMRHTYTRLGTTPVYFVGLPYVHFMKGVLSYEFVDIMKPEWKREGSCNWVPRPLNASQLPGIDPRAVIIEKVLGRSPRINLLRISESVRARADAHIGLLRAPPPPPPGEKPAPFRPQDCGHFCIPGVPDSWNELFFATLVQQGKVDLQPPPLPPAPPPDNPPPRPKKGP